MMYLKEIIQTVNRFIQKHRILLRLKAKFPDSFIHIDTQITDQVVLGKGTSIRAGVVLRGDCKIAKATFCNGPSTIAASQGSRVEIGSFCSIANNVSIFSGNHSMTTPSSFQTSAGKYSNIFGGITGKCKDIVIGSDVWVGAHVVVVGGVDIGHGAVIGAGSIVTKDIPPYAIAVGNPAAIVRYRFSEPTIQWLLRLKWWEWSDSKICRNKLYFECDLNTTSTLEVEDLIND